MKRFVFELNGQITIEARNYDAAIKELMDTKIIDVDMDYEQIEGDD